jgi:hypothetical protein
LLSRRLLQQLKIVDLSLIKKWKYTTNEARRSHLNNIFIAAGFFLWRADVVSEKMMVTELSLVCRPF